MTTQLISKWLLQFVEDSFADFPANPLGGTMTAVKTEISSFPAKPRKRSRAPAAFVGTFSPMPESEQQIHSAGKFKQKKVQSGGGGGGGGGGEGMRRCTQESEMKWLDQQDDDFPYCSLFRNLSESDEKPENMDPHSSVMAPVCTSTRSNHEINNSLERNSALSRYKEKKKS